VILRSVDYLKDWAILGELMFKAIKAMFLFLVFFSYNVNAQLFSAYTYEDSSCYCQGAESSKSSFESNIKARTE